MNILKLIIFTSCLSIPSHSMSQSPDTPEKLCNKKWVIKSYETDGHVAPATGPETDYTIFNADHTQRSISNGTVLTSRWKFDAASNTITLYSDDNTRETTEMKIIALTEDTFASEVKIRDGVLRVNMTCQTADN